jgi:Holin of 3TMs, for gene-transfer release
MNPLALGGIVQAIGQIADDLVTTDKERLDAELELRRLGLEERKVEADLVRGQLEVNRAEAASSSLFVAGWRPAIGWIGAAALGYQFLLYPLLVWAWALLQARGVVPGDLRPPPMLDTDALWVVLSGMLGIAGLRSVEKVKGVAR